MWNGKEIGTTDGYPPHYIKIHNPTNEVKYLDGRHCHLCTYHY